MSLSGDPAVKPRSVIILSPLSVSRGLGLFSSSSGMAFIEGMPPEEADGSVESANLKAGLAWALALRCCYLRLLFCITQHMQVMPHSIPIKQTTTKASINSDTIFCTRVSFSTWESCLLTVSYFCCNRSVDFCTSFWMSTISSSISSISLRTSSMSSFKPS